MFITNQHEYLSVYDQLYKTTYFGQKKGPFLNAGVFWFVFPDVLLLISGMLKVWVINLFYRKKGNFLSDQILPTIINYYNTYSI